MNFLEDLGNLAAPLKAVLDLLKYPRNEPDILDLLKIYNDLQNKLPKLYFNCTII